MLGRALDGASRRQVFVAARSRGESAFVTASDGGVIEPGVADVPMPVGCLAKLLTATLATRIFAKRQIAIDMQVVDLLDAGTAYPALEGVTLRHLLEHTHGLDDSLIRRAPLRDGLIDASNLLLRTSSERPLAEPGVIYSYGNIGAWLVAAVMERCTRRPYAALLRDELLAPLGMSVDSASATGGYALVCPATGVGLSLSAADWLRFLVHATVESTWPGDRCEQESTAIRRLPGWNPLEHGVYLGWKYHGHGWFGHQSVWPRSSALVRVNPHRGSAFVLISRDHPASVVAGRMLCAAVPELFDLRVPMLLEHGALTDPQRYVGRFGCAAVLAEISLHGDVLELRVEEGGPVGARGGPRCGALAPAAAHTFFVRPPGIESFPYVQWIVGGLGGAAYLWNGRFVLRRL